MFYLYSDSSQPWEINPFLTVVNTKVMVLLFNRWGILVWSCFYFLQSLVGKQRLLFFLVNFFISCSCLHVCLVVLLCFFWCSFENFSVSRRKCLVKFCPQLPGGKKSEKCIDFADIKLDVYWSNQVANQQKFILFSLLICKLNVQLWGHITKTQLFVFNCFQFKAQDPAPSKVGWPKQCLCFGKMVKTVV